MKNVIKVLGIIAFVAVIGFSLVTCETDTDDDDGGGGGSGTFIMEGDYAENGYSYYFGNESSYNVTITINEQGSTYADEDWTVLKNVNKLSKTLGPDSLDDSFVAFFCSKSSVEVNYSPSDKVTYRFKGDGETYFENGTSGGSGGGGTGGGGTGGGRTTCSSCNGSGKCKYDDYMPGYVTCGGCYGSGYNYRGNLCGACDGFGFNKCWVCSGSGKCQICYGTGYTSGTGGGSSGGGGTTPPADTGTIIFKNNNSFTLTSVYVYSNSILEGLALVSANGSRTFSNVTVGNIRIEANGTSGFTVYNKDTTFTLSKNETKTVTATSSGLYVSGGTW